jgi:glycosyltransferase involved in cell wall biosynthesis
LRAEVDRLVLEKGLRIVDLGQMPHERLLGIYGQARALLFASYAESFGIPLIEASKAGLPILAAEMDFVRDVCTPSVTFDPHSPRSIARAVLRFLGETIQSVDLLTPEAFVQRLLVHAKDGAPRTIAVGAGE